METLKNKTVLITGAGAGMGKAMTDLFLKHGAHVIATDINRDRLADLGKDHNNAAQLTIQKMNVGIEDEVNSVISETIKSRGTLHIVINNAGILDDFMPVDQTSTELWTRVMNINVNGPFFVCRAAIPQMLKHGSGVIINISSIGGLHGSRAGAAYTTSKHALIGLSKNIAFMYAKSGIRCNIIAPGAVETSIGENMHPNPLGYEKLSLGLSTNPRTGKPNEIAEVALFLASDKASFVNGSTITVDGGWTAY